MANSHWQGKRVLASGAHGFIGSHLAERLAGEGAQVPAFIMYNSFNSSLWLDQSPSHLRETMEVFPGDVRDAEVEQAIGQTVQLATGRDIS